MTIHNKIGQYLAPGRAWYTRNVNTITKFSVHHDAIPHDNRTAEEVMKSIMDIHNKKNGWPGMSYHYYIHRDGQVYWVNKHEWVTWIDGINWDAIGIVVNGYFHPPVNNDPANASGTPQLRALRELLDELSTKHPEFPAAQGDVYAHRERAATACPGDKLFGYVFDYRQKLGKVPWGQAPAPTPEPPSEDWEKKYKDLEKEHNDYKSKYNEDTKNKAVSDAINALNKKIDEAQKL